MSLPKKPSPRHFRRVTIASPGPSSMASRWVRRQVARTARVRRNHRSGSIGRFLGGSGSGPRHVRHGPLRVGGQGRSGVDDGDGKGGYGPDVDRRVVPVGKGTAIAAGGVEGAAIGFNGEAVDALREGGRDLVGGDVADGVVAGVLVPVLDGGQLGRNLRRGGSDGVESGSAGASAAAEFDGAEVAGGGSVADLDVDVLGSDAAIDGCAVVHVN